MTARVNSVVLEDPPMSGVLTLPSLMTLYVAAAIELAKWSSPRCLNIIVEERMKAAGFAMSWPIRSLAMCLQPGSKRANSCSTR